MKDHEERNARRNLNLWMLALIAAALIFGFAKPTASLVQGALSERLPDGAIVFGPPPELPREWKWRGPKGVDYKSMYRNSEPDRIDWIRENRSR